MHLVIQIPCYNEAATIGEVIRSLPDHLKGITEISVLVIDDGSHDGSGQVALNADTRGVVRLVRHVGNRGLAAAFVTGVEAALEMGADIIVNTDADGQYPAKYLAALVAPIVQGQAEIVIGDRQPAEVAHFSPIKRLLQRLGSLTLSLLMGMQLPDPVSGFRAFSRDVAERLKVTTDFSYTLETLIQAVQLKRAIRFVPIVAQPTPRPSRLARSVTSFVMRSAATILRVFVLYYPLRSFAALAAVPFACGAVLIMRYAWLFSIGDGAGHVQSLVIGSLSLSVASLLAAIGIVAESLRVNRRMLQELHHFSRHNLLTAHSPEPALTGTESTSWR